MGGNPGRVLAAAVFVIAVIGAAWPSAAATPRTYVVSGNIFYADNTGNARRITASGIDREAVLSPDGTKIAFIRVEARATQEGDGDHTALYVFDVGSNRLVRAAVPHEGKDPADQFMTIGNPVSSLDGGYVYVLASAWATSAAIHQISLAKGTERYVAPGNSDLIVRSGPWRGYLLVAQHRYWPAGGSYNPTFVVRPDGHEMLMVPGSQADDGVDHVSAWLTKNGWSAW